MTKEAIRDFFEIMAKHFALRYLIPFIPTIAVNILVLLSFITSKKRYQGIVIVILLLLCFKLNVKITGGANYHPVNVQSDCQPIYFNGANSPIYN
jgi:hypothetical protein